MNSTSFCYKGKEKKNRLLRLLLLYFAQIGLGFAALAFLYYGHLFFALMVLVVVYVINQKYYVCPECGARLNSRVVLTKTSVCGKCHTYLVNGKKIT